jgi:hypothetical protein
MQRDHTAVADELYPSSPFTCAVVLPVEVVVSVSIGRRCPGRCSSRIEYLIHHCAAGAVVRGPALLSNGVLGNGGGGGRARHRHHGDAVNVTAHARIVQITTTLLQSL